MAQVDQEVLPSPDEVRTLPPDGGPAFNRLVFEKSPYLLQHARNPVDWYPWGEEAFEKAKQEDRPVFLSIGYSTCHWCHVMERESFQDTEVAEALNRDFVSVKVDREEREDVDSIYMAACMAMTGHGGWPLTVILTPDGRPFFAGTYFPRTGKHGRPGLLDLLAHIARLWRQDRQRLLQDAQVVTKWLTTRQGASAGEVSVEALENAFVQLCRGFDPVYGGFGDAPKFPSPHNLLFLLRYARRTGTDEGVRMVSRTLREMRMGGIFDHVGFGFHRYSTDRRWFVPHFEKMLYDQAMLLHAYTEAYLATGEEFFAGVAREIATYVLRDMTSPEGAFYSAEDADSEGEEGKFYLWTKAELLETLGEDGPLLCDLFGVEEGGNFDQEAAGRQAAANILHQRFTFEAFANDKGLDVQTLRTRWEQGRRMLFDVRRQRIHPLKDDKVLTAWNGLMISALAKASVALQEPAWAEAAERALAFLAENLRREDGRLLRRWRQGEARFLGYLNDYAFLAWGLLELYQATFRTDYLRRAVELVDEQNIFWDESAGGYFFAAANDTTLIHRPKEVYDGAVPSGNSVSAMNLLRLARMTGRTDLEERANRIFGAFGRQVGQNESGHTMLLCALDFAEGPTREIVIAGDPADEATRGLVAEVRRRFLPDAVVMLHAPGDRLLGSLAPFARRQGPVKGRAAAYVCQSFACEQPVTDPADLGRLLDR